MATWPVCVAPSPRATLGSRARNDDGWKPLRLIWTWHPQSSKSRWTPPSLTLMPHSPAMLATLPCSRLWPQALAWPRPSTECWARSVSATTADRGQVTLWTREGSLATSAGRIGLPARDFWPAIDDSGRRASGRRRRQRPSVNPIGCDDASHHRVDGASRGHRQGPVWSRVTDLTEQVDDLLAATDEIAGTDLAVAKDDLEALTASPSVHHPGHARVRTAGCRQHVPAFDVLKLAPSPDHGLSLIHISEPTRLGMSSYA